MAKGNGFGKFVLMCGVVGAAAAGAYYYMTQRDKALADDFDDDFDDFDDFDDAFDDAREKRGYVDLGGDDTAAGSDANDARDQGGEEEESAEEEEEPEPAPAPEPEPVKQEKKKKDNPLQHIAEMMQNQAKHAEEQARAASEKAKKTAEKMTSTAVETEDFFDDTN